MGEKQTSLTEGHQPMSAIILFGICALNSWGLDTRNTTVHARLNQASMSHSLSKSQAFL